MSSAKQTCNRTLCLLVNLGTPDAPDAASVRRYLREFLSDPRVVEAPRLIWWLVLNCIILPLRPRRVARLYASIWEQDSPIRSIGLELAEKVGAQLQHEFQDAQVDVELAMTYGRPSLRQRLDRSVQEGVRRIVVLPMYPQYSASTTAAVFDQCATFLQSGRDLPELHLLRAYPCDQEYVAALAQSVSAFRQQHGAAQRLLMSFHGIPQQYADAGDPYPLECETSAGLLAETLELRDEEWLMTYQSRFGPKAWLQPYTDKTLEQLAMDGVRSVDVICPGFSFDCLETLEEIAQQNREIFIAAGGESLRYIPALNASDAHVQLVSKLLRRYL